MAKYTRLTDELYEYMAEHRSDRDPLLAELAEETRRLGDVARMQIAPEQGALLTLLVRVAGARDAIEIGTFTGYSALCIARGLPAEGTLLCCDSSEEWTAIARRYFDRAQLRARVELRVAPARDTLRALERAELFDFAFVDADKASYLVYLEELLPRLRPGGLIFFDNVFWGGRVVDPADTSESTRTIRALNDRVRDEPSLESVMLAVADGVLIARKRAPEAMVRTAEPATGRPGSHRRSRS